MFFRIFLTYTKKNPKTSQIYSGRTSGWGNVFSILKKRDKHHHKNNEGYSPAVIDKSSTNSDAIRGREQMMIDEHGGAKSSGGTSGNIINAIGLRNKKRNKYLAAALKLFGAVSIVVLIIFIFKTRF